MKKYEYDVLEQDFQFDSLDNYETVQMLSDRGSNGWELVSVTTEIREDRIRQEGDKVLHRQVFYFKRELTEDN